MIGEIIPDPRWRWQRILDDHRLWLGFIAAGFGMGLFTHEWTLPAIVIVIGGGMFPNALLRKRRLEKNLRVWRMFGEDIVPVVRLWLRNPVSAPDQTSTGMMVFEVCISPDDPVGARKSNYRFDRHLAVAEFRPVPPMPVRLWLK